MEKLRKFSTIIKCAKCCRYIWIEQDARRIHAQMSGTFLAQPLEMMIQLAWNIRCLFAHFLTPRTFFFLRNPWINVKYDIEDGVTVLLYSQNFITPRLQCFPTRSCPIELCKTNLQKSKEDRNLTWEVGGGRGGRRSWTQHKSNLVGNYLISKRQLFSLKIFLKLFFLMT